MLDRLLCGVGWGCLTVENRVGGAVESAPDLVVMDAYISMLAFVRACTRMHQPSANGLLLLAYHD